MTASLITAKFNKSLVKKEQSLIRLTSSIKVCQDVCYDFDYPGDGSDISPGTLAIKANDFVTWEAAEALSENGIQSARLFAKVAQWRR